MEQIKGFVSVVNAFSPAPLAVIFLARVLAIIVALKM